MIQLGEYNRLRILRDTDPGLFLGDDEDNEVLLPNRYVPNTFEIDDVLDVFRRQDRDFGVTAAPGNPKMYPPSILINFSIILSK